MDRIITLTTDFGMRDGFVGMMKGVILSLNPRATIVDITHEIAPQNVEEGAFLFAASARYFPASAIHVVVVDPGVGGSRRSIAAQTGETLYVAPDNGILSSVLRPSSHVISLTKPEFWLPRVSNTFHGRDIFSPSAAHLSLGAPLRDMGEPIMDWVKLPSILPTRRGDGRIVGRVAHIDQYGNIVTNISEETLGNAELARVVVEIAGRQLVGLKRSYAEASEGELIALFGSSWELEIAQINGNAAKTLGIFVGAAVAVLG